MLTSLQYKCVNKQTRWVRVRRVFKVRNFRTRTWEKSADLDSDSDVRKALLETHDKNRKSQKLHSLESFCFSFYTTSQRAHEPKCPWDHESKNQWDQDPMSPSAHEPMSPWAQWNEAELFTSFSFLTTSRRAHEPLSPWVQAPMSTRAQEPMSPWAQEPNSSWAQQLMSPTAHEPNSTWTQQHMSPTAHEPKTPRTLEPRSPNI
jgi:hypothetical protein